LDILENKASHCMQVIGTDVSTASFSKDSLSIRIRLSTRPLQHELLNWRQQP